MAVSDDTQPIDVSDLLGPDEMEPTPVRSIRMSGSDLLDGESFIRAVSSVAQAMRMLSTNAMAADREVLWDTLEIATEHNQIDNRTLVGRGEIVHYTQINVSAETIAVSETGTTDPAQPGEKKE